MNVQSSVSFFTRREYLLLPAKIIRPPWKLIVETFSVLLANARALVSHLHTRDDTLIPFFLPSRLPSLAEDEDDDDELDVVNPGSLIFGDPSPVSFPFGRGPEEASQLLS